ncbi:MAG: ribosomal protection-like ABC-F family protein [Flavisolibacter sp.]
MLILQNLSYIHPNKTPLFDNINLAVNDQEKIALIGNNGSGKSTLLKLIAKELKPSGGKLFVNAEPWFVPQIFGQYSHLTVAQALKVENKLNALQEILKGNVSEQNYSALGDDWTIEERCNEALKYWQLTNVELLQKMATLSGGQKTKVFLAGISIHQPELVLLDEPGNHLDVAGRQLLYSFIHSTQSTLLIVSHDRKLLNLFGKVAELSNHGLTIYGGNYDFYKGQKEIQNALHQDLQSKEKALRKAKEKERETLERQQKLNSRGKAKQEKAGVARIMMNSLRNNAENSTSKLKDVHTEKIVGIREELQELRSALPGIDKMKFGFDNSYLHRGKILCKAEDINYNYNHKPLWKDNLTFQITSEQRLVLKGLNGSGKTTLLKIILGKLEPQTGAVYRADNKVVYIDQDYSLIDNHRSVYEQAEQFKVSALQEHEIKTRLNRFLFTKNDWDKSCSALSGGEKMRLILCCLTIHNQSPDIIILDEPTNNLDIQNIEILTAAINEYQGTLIVVSHDETFLEQIKIEQTIQL